MADSIGSEEKRKQISDSFKGAVSGSDNGLVDKKSMLAALKDRLGMGNTKPESMTE